MVIFRNTKCSLTKQEALPVITIFLFWALFLVSALDRMQFAPVDDAFIFLRVADNVIEGVGWTYNNNDSVNSITAPLYVLLLAIPRLLGFSPLSSLMLVYFAGLVSLSYLQYFAFYQFGRWFSVAAAICISAGAVLTKSFGMETSWFLFLVASAIFACSRQFYSLSFFLAGLATLCRPEGLALAPLLIFMSGKSTSWASFFRAGWFFVAVLPWVVFSFYRFGSVIPHTVAVKALQAKVGLASELEPWLFAFLSQPKYPILTWVVAILGVGVSIKQFLRGNSYFLLVIIFGVLQVGAYSLLGAPVGYFWYWAPGNFASDTATTLLVVVCAKWAFNRFQVSGFRLQGSRLCVSSVVVFMVVALVLNHVSVARIRSIQPYRLASEYYQMGIWIKANYPSSISLACTEIGYLGYFSGKPIRDIHGLIHGEALEYLRQGQWDWWYEYDATQLIVVHKSAWHSEPSIHNWGKEKYGDFVNRYASVFSTKNLVLYSKL